MEGILENNFPFFRVCCQPPTCWKFYKSEMLVANSWTGTNINQRGWVHWPGINGYEEVSLPKVQTLRNYGYSSSKVHWFSWIIFYFLFSLDKIMYFIQKNDDNIHKSEAQRTKQTNENWLKVTTHLIFIKKNIDLEGKQKFHVNFSKNYLNTR